MIIDSPLAGNTTADECTWTLSDGVLQASAQVERSGGARIARILDDEYGVVSHAQKGYPHKNRHTAHPQWIRCPVIVVMNFDATLAPSICKGPLQVVAPCFLEALTGVDTDAHLQSEQVSKSGSPVNGWCPFTRSKTRASC